MTTINTGGADKTCDSPASVGLLKQQRGLIFGTAHETSIAWAIAKALAAAGMQLALAYQPERAKRVEKLAAEIEGVIAFPCDVRNDADLDKLFTNIQQTFGQLDTVVHSIAFARTQDLAGSFLDASREGYAVAQDISSFSLIAIAKRAYPLLKKAGGGSLMTLSYIGGERVMPGYGIMAPAKAALETTVRYLAGEVGQHNIRVNAISAGPILTLASRGVPGFFALLDFIEQHAPLRRNVLAEEVADTALFLASPLSRGITGEVIHVDAGYHAIGFSPIGAAK